MNTLLVFRRKIQQIPLRVFDLDYVIILKVIMF